LSTSYYNTFTNALNRINKIYSKWNTIQYF
jgi:hypothetical protein